MGDTRQEHTNERRTNDKMNIEERMKKMSTEKIVRYVAYCVLMKHKGMTPDAAMRVQEFEFQIDEKERQLDGLDYWLGNGRRKNNCRHIDLSADAEFDELFFKGVVDVVKPDVVKPRPSQSNAPALD